VEIVGHYLLEGGDKGLGPIEFLECCDPLLKIQVSIFIIITFREKPMKQIGIDIIPIQNTVDDNPILKLSKCNEFGLV